MNSIRSPAPGVGLFNLPNSRKNNALVVAANNVAVMANNAVRKANTAVNSITKDGPSASQMVLIALLLITVVIFGLFWKPIMDGLKDIYEYIRLYFGANPAPLPKSEDEQKPVVTNRPISTDDEMTKEKKFVEKILPGHQQVFNINKNTYTYYDAEPLCKALGSELATYEQVKEAYAKGAEWCNYGWVKGQMAVFPTQKKTWDDLQNGPEEQRMSCGRPGVNGGFFDNPELRFGVNCFGAKPEQKDHDATQVASGEGAPLSPGNLQLQKKIAKYRGESSSIGILPWNTQNWSG